MYSTTFELVISLVIVLPKIGRIKYQFQIFTKYSHLLRKLPLIYQNAQQGNIYQKTSISCMYESHHGTGLLRKQQGAIKINMGVPFNNAIIIWDPI